MKARDCLLGGVLVCLTLGVGCSVPLRSVHPWFDETLTVTDTEILLGVWKLEECDDNDDPCFVQVVRGVETPLRILHYDLDADLPDEWDRGRWWGATLGRVGEHYFLDIQAERVCDDEEYYLDSCDAVRKLDGADLVYGDAVRVHLPVRIEFGGDTLRARVLSEDNVEEHLDIEIVARGERYVSSTRVIVSPTERLQRYLEQHGGVDWAWSPVLELEKVR